MGDVSHASMVFVSFLLRRGVSFYLFLQRLFSVLRKSWWFFVTYSYFHLISVDEDLIEHLTQDETSRLDLDFEEWDVAGLPWWFLGNLRNNSIPRSNGSTDLQTNQVRVQSEGSCCVGLAYCDCIAFLLLCFICMNRMPRSLQTFPNSTVNAVHKWWTL